MIPPNTSGLSGPYRGSVRLGIHSSSCAMHVNTEDVHRLQMWRTAHSGPRSLGHPTYKLPIFTTAHLQSGDGAPHSVFGSHSVCGSRLISFPKQPLYQISPPLHLGSSSNSTPPLGAPQCRLFTGNAACDFIGVGHIVNTLSAGQYTVRGAERLMTVISAVCNLTNLHSIENPETL